MSHFANDVHHRASTRLTEVIPDFVESEYPAFVAFLKAYYEFLEQYDDLPTTSTYTPANGVITVLSGNSTITGGGTQFLTNTDYANNVQIRVGSDQFRIRSIANNTSLTVYELPIRSYFANTHTVETNRSIRQASGAARQILSIHDVDHTLDDFIAYFRDTYLRDIPQGPAETATLLPRILDFYQAKGSEQSYQFLFRSLFDKEVQFSYPRESVFMTSDNEYVKPILMRMKYDTDASVTGNVALLETREIIGLTSNARATVLRSVVTHEGERRVVRMSISEPIISRELGGLLLEDGTQLLATKYGIPPEGLAGEVYTYSLVQELVKATTFMAGETVSTIPTNDPNAITGELLGSITGFTIENLGVGYQEGDFVYPPTKYADGTIATGGFGAIGRISGVTAVDITSIKINDPGVGYYVGLPLIVDNSGTGGYGLSGSVSKVTPGNILISHDGSPTSNNLADGDILTFIVENGQEFTAEREKINYYEVGVSLADLFGGLLLDDADDPDNDGDDLVDETDRRQLLQESAIPLSASVVSSVTLGGGADPGGQNYVAGDVVAVASGSGGIPAKINVLTVNAAGGVLTVSINAAGSYTTLPTQANNTPSGGTGTGLRLNLTLSTTGYSWSDTAGSAIYGVNLQTTIIGLISNISIYPIYINGVNLIEAELQNKNNNANNPITEIGEIVDFNIDNYGQGYVLGFPTLAVQTPIAPTKDREQTQPLRYSDIFNEEFRIAKMSIVAAVGQLSEVQVLTGGTGYENRPFWVARTISTGLNFLTENGEYVLQENSGYLLFDVNGIGYSGTSSTINGSGGKVGMTLGALSYGIPYFKNTRSFASADQYLQDVTKYQPFSYVMTVEESLTRYAEIVRRLVHPAGGLLIPRQTITTELDLIGRIVSGHRTILIGTNTIGVSVGSNNVG